MHQCRNTNCMREGRKRRGIEREGEGQRGEGEGQRGEGEGGGERVRQGEKETGRERKRG